MAHHLIVPDVTERAAEMKYCFLLKGMVQMCLDQCTIDILGEDVSTTQM